MRLQIIKNKDGREGVHVDGGKLIGYVMRLEDGYYSFEFLVKTLDFIRPMI